MEKLIHLFPKINKINYDVINHLTLKNTCLFIPKGPKAFAWFTYYNNKSICLFYNQDQQKIFTKYVSFKEELSLGTIIYGTLIDNHFVCETIHLYKNESVGGNFVTKLNLIKDILKFSIKDSDFEHQISFKLPQMSNSKILLECSNLPYHVYGILQIDNRPKLIILSHLFGHFHIKKDESLEDVYSLYTFEGEQNKLENKSELNDSNNSNNFVFHSTALVNDFKTSHFLKKLFKIKTTYKNIEFETEECGEIIDSKEQNNCVSCIYIHEFKKWKPYISKHGTPDSTKTIVFKEKKNIAL
jgi:hypothetical protein